LQIFFVGSAAFSVFCVFSVAFGASSMCVGAALIANRMPKNDGGT
jgi:hypothetical protein